MAIWLLASPPSLGAPGVSSTLSPPYRGATAHSYVISTSGCGATSSTPATFTFHETSGLATGRFAGRAGHCTASRRLGLLFPVSSSAIDTGFTAELQLPKFPAGASNLTVNLTGNLTFRGEATSGGRAATCTEPLVNETYNYTYWDWNYSFALGRFLSYGYVLDYQLNGSWTNTSYFTSPLPNPFPHVNSTYYYSSAGRYLYAACYAEAYAYLGLYPVLLDETTGATYDISNSTAVLVEEVGVEVYKYTEYGEYNYSIWVGPVNYTFTQPSTPVSYNTSEVSRTWSLAETWWTVRSSNSTGRRSSVSGDLSIPLTGTSFWFDGSWGRSDRYLLEWDGWIECGAVNTWPRGETAYRLSAAGTGLGVGIAEISIR